MELGATEHLAAARKVTERWRTGFRYDIDPPVDLRGFSGAPILDEDGHVAGVMSLGFEARKQGNKYLEGGAEDAASVRRLVER